LDDLLKTLEIFKIIFDGNIDSKENKQFYDMVITQMNFIKKIKIEMALRGSKFNIIKYLNSEKERLLKNKDSKKRKKNDDYESESEDNTTEEEDDDEEDNKKKNNKKNKKLKKEETEDDDDGDDDDDDDDDDDEEEEEYCRMHDDKSNKNKLGRELMEQVYKNKNGSFSNEFEDESLKYFNNLSNRERKDVITKIKDINNYQNSEKPVLFQIMNFDLPLPQKNQILKNYLTVATSRSEQNKLKQWVESVMQIPFGKYKGINLDSIKPEKVKDFIGKLQKTMDDAVWGHEEAKRQIIQMMGQLIRNPKSKGNMLGLWGCPGNGKTSILKDGVAKAMDKPFIFISLGGATDASFLEGHSYTWEGSIYGRIANGLITSKCMDPIIYFDELDKISKTPKGDEITNILVHLTDPVQNTHFRDKYFHGIDIDLSKATMIFSFNNPENVNPILLDRITTIETKYLLTSQKIHIAKNYLLPEIFKDIGLKENAVVIHDDIVRGLINKYTHEGGVRKLKGLLYSIVRELNIANLTGNKIDDNTVSFPFTIKQEHMKILLKYKMEIDPEKIHDKPKCGIVNGLYAGGSTGTGGVLPIEVVWFPSSKPLEIKATGNLEKVIKESTEVACSLAWNILDDHLKNKYMEFWKKKPMGFHIHCPEGAVPKDGPSAGAALTLAIYSLLTNRKIKNTIAMTGEINLQGNVMQIGGLEEKLEGAKRAGVQLALLPKDNKKHLDKIIERNASLFDDTFKIEIIEKFEDVVKHALLPYSSKDTPMITGFEGNLNNVEDLNLDEDLDEDKDLEKDLVKATTIKNKYNHYLNIDDLNKDSDDDYN
jgi:ATP-dependent Lon protease